jgi:hypothetical protein
VIVVLLWCPECRARNPLGCFDGGVWVVGPFTDALEAEAYGLRETIDTPGWLYAVSEAKERAA